MHQLITSIQLPVTVVVRNLLRTCRSYFITYIVLVQMLNHAQSINLLRKLLSIEIKCDLAGSV